MTAAWRHGRVPVDPKAKSLRVYLTRCHHVRFRLSRQGMAERQREDLTLSVSNASCALSVSEKSGYRFKRLHRGQACQNGQLVGDL